MNQSQIGTILLYYHYVDLESPEEIAHWQRELCTKLDLRGRIIVATEGINGTLGGTPENTAHYIATMHAHPLFASMPFKQSTGSLHEFPRLRVVVKKEIVNLGIEPSELKASDGGQHLSPAETHELLSNRPDNLVVIDCRNDYESMIGRIDGALMPDTTYFREFPAYVDRTLETLKDKPVLMYCTGGVRCERASAYLKKKGVKTVYQIAGGIHEYINAFPQGHFKGKMYVFDERRTITVSNDQLATCTHCLQPCSDVTNCASTSCNRQYPVCEACTDAHLHTCSTTCEALVMSGSIKVRTRWHARSDCASTHE